MDPFTLALATFGVQKLRGKSTRTALKDAALVWVVLLLVWVKRE